MTGVRGSTGVSACRYTDTRHARTLSASWTCIVKMRWMGRMAGMLAEVQCASISERQRPAASDQRPAVSDQHAGLTRPARLRRHGRAGSATCVRCGRVQRRPAGGVEPAGHGPSAAGRRGDVRGTGRGRAWCSCPHAAGPRRTACNRTCTYASAAQQRPTEQEGLGVAMRPRSAFTASSASIEPRVVVVRGVAGDLRALARRISAPCAGRTPCRRRPPTTSGLRARAGWAGSGGCMARSRSRRSRARAAH